MVKKFKSLEAIPKKKRHTHDFQETDHDGGPFYYCKSCDGYVHYCRYENMYILGKPEVEKTFSTKKKLLF